MIEILFHSLWYLSRSCAIALLYTPVLYVTKKALGDRIKRGKGPPSLLEAAVAAPVLEELLFGLIPAVLGKLVEARAIWACLRFLNARYKTDDLLAYIILDTEIVLLQLLFAYFIYIPIYTSYPPPTAFKIAVLEHALYNLIVFSIPRLLK